MIFSTLKLFFISMYSQLPTWIKYMTLSRVSTLALEVLCLLIIDLQTSSNKILIGIILIQLPTYFLFTTSTEIKQFLYQFSYKHSIQICESQSNVRVLPYSKLHRRNFIITNYWLQQTMSSYYYLKDLEKTVRPLCNYKHNRTVSLIET